MNTKFLLLIGLSTFAGCAETPGPYHRFSSVKSSVIMLPADQAWVCPPAPSEWDRRDIPSGPGAVNGEGVQTGVELSAIQFNRYPDPTFPDRLMHEAHLVYRRESGPRWKLGNAAVQTPVQWGSSSSDGRAEIQPLALQELQTFLRDQRLRSEEEAESIGKLGSQLQRLGEEQHQLRGEISVLKMQGCDSPKNESQGAVLNSVPPVPENSNKGKSHDPDAH